MKKLLLATTAIILAVPALAADLPRRSPAAAPAPAFVQTMSWTGFYAGVNVGYVATEQWGQFPLTVQPSGATVGARLGFDYQAGANWVIGLTGDIDKGFGEQNVFLFPFKLSVPYFASLNLRVGYLITPATLLYATGGYTYADVKLSGAVPISPDNAKGFNFGAGIEHRLNQNWSVFGEYRFTDLRLNQAIIVANSDRDANAHAFKLGVNYRFGSAGPVVARY